MGLTYEQIKTVIDQPPSPKLIGIFNELEVKITENPLCVTQEYPFEHLAHIGNFCITASSIQSKYIAFVLGKHVETTFPTEVMQLLFNIDPSVKLQFAKIKGLEYDGCISCLHEEHGFFDLQRIYDMIYLNK